MNSCHKKLNVKDIDEKFWKTIAYERQLYENRKQHDDNKPNNPNKQLKAIGKLNGRTNLGYTCRISWNTN